MSLLDNKKKYLHKGRMSRGTTLIPTSYWLTLKPVTRETKFPN